MSSYWESLRKILRTRIFKAREKSVSAVRSAFGILRPRKSLKYIWIYNFLVLSLVAYFGGSALFSLQKARSEPIPISAAPEPAKATIKAAAPLPPLEDYKVVIERNLFGGTPQGGMNSQPEEFSPEDVPLAQRSVGLKLVGTVVTDEPAKNVAIIENQRAHKQEAYHEGDQVDQILIKRILRNNVIISTGTEEQRLTMDLEEDAGSTPATGQTVGNSRPMYDPRSVYRRPSPPSRRTVRTMPRVPSRKPVQSEQAESETNQPVVQDDQPESEAYPPEVQSDQPESESGAMGSQQQEIDSALADTDKVRE